jgi:hypothetical protein
MEKLTGSENPDHAHVGYCSPPVHSRFRRGESGNPHGRPKGTLNLATVLERTLREKVIINENGKRKTITKLEASIKQLADKSASGDIKAFQLLSALVRFTEERAIKTVAPNSTLDEFDEKVVIGILNRLEPTKKGDQEDESKAE